MSTYTKNSAVYLGNLAAIRTAQPQHEAQFRAITEGLTSSALSDFHAELLSNYAFATADDAQIAWGRIERDLPWDSVLSDATYREFSVVESRIESLHQYDEDEMGSWIAAIQGAMLDAVQAAAREMAGYEQMAAAEAVDLALHDLGYAVVAVPVPGVVTGFEASRGNSKLLVQVASGGEVTTDHVGLSGDESCGSAQQAFVERVGYYGVGLTENDRNFHGDPRGGGLAQRAARACGSNLAERIVSSYGAARRGRDEWLVRATIRKEIA
jgi:hypothetical protein